jgi:hyperosmotically inducible protein
MNFKKMVAVLFVSASAVLLAPGCKSKPKDADIKASVETAIANPAVEVNVKEADVTLSGTVQDDAAKNAAETAAKSVKDVKGVTNAISVTPPPPPPATVEISDDSELVKGVNTLVKNYKSVNATVNNGVVTLTGNIKRDELPKLMQAVMALRPKNVDNKLTVK